MRCLFILFLLTTVVGLRGQQINAPDGNITLSFTTSPVTLTAAAGDEPLFTLASGLKIDGRELPSGKAKVGKIVSVDRIVEPVVATKRQRITDRYQELSVAYGDGVTLQLRVYNEGVAYRYLGLPAGKLEKERYELQLTADTELFYPTETSFYSHNERTYERGRPADFTNQLASLPALAELPSGHYLWLSESDLYDYPGLWLAGSANGLTGVHPALPRVIRDTSDRMQTFERYDHLAELSSGARTPWRLIGVAAAATDLLDNQLTYLTASPSEGDFSWVRPGQVAWDWYNANLLKGVDFTAGVNTETYKYYIDFAARNDIGYVILDEGWSPTTEVTTTVEEIDLEEIIAYGKQRGVGVILWVLWKPFLDNVEEVCAQYASWGVRGVKVDFMQRDDQAMVNHYRTMAATTAKHRLLVDFHGAYKPAGLHRTFPNVITREGLKGLEWYKFGNPGSGVGPDHNCTLPFIRMVAGPIDFTPGAMANAQLANHHYNFDHPTSLGTRAHQLAMYVVYESPLQMLADAPTDYEAEPEVTDFITEVPTVWKNTVPLLGKIGDYVAIAREARNGDWYLGALNDWDTRELEVTLDFLPDGDYQLNLFRDGPNHARHAEDYTREVIGVTAGQQLTLPLGKGGGWVGRLRAR